MKHILFTSLILIAMSNIVSGQTAPPKSCTSPECSQFDFWVGDWDLTYSDTVHATNHIIREMGGCVIHEHFDDPAHSYKGESWSVYSPKKKMWQQTWVDGQGAYITLTGEFADGKVILLAEPVSMPDGTKQQSRMVYDNIKPNSFEWNWEATTDDGKTWKNNWRIHYKRRLQ